MAALVLTGTPQSLTLAPGSPVWFTNTNSSAATVTFGYTSAGTASQAPVAVTLVANTGTAAWAWPGIFINYGITTLWLVASVSTGVTMFYPS